MDILFVIISIGGAVLVMVGLPPYLYLLAKWMQVGRMVGARWFCKRYGKEQ